MLELNRNFNTKGDFMTTPKWMIGLMACCAFLIADCDNDKDCGDDNNSCPQASLTVDEE